MPKTVCALLTLLVPLFVVAACSTTRIARSWINPRAVRPTSVMVFGVTHEESVRRGYEDAVSLKLSAGGLPTTPSYDVIKNQGEVTPEEAITAVRRARVDAVLITRHVRLEREIQVAPDISATPPFAYRGMGPFYSPPWPSYYSNSYRLIEHEAAYIESNLYKADSSALLISILTRTEDPTYSIRQTEELATLVTGEIIRAGFLTTSK